MYERPQMINDKLAILVNQLHPQTANTVEVCTSTFLTNLLVSLSYPDINSQVLTTITLRTDYVPDYSYLVASVLVPWLDHWSFLFSPHKGVSLSLFLSDILEAASELDDKSLGASSTESDEGGGRNTNYY